MVKVKICGITNWADAKAALDAGADALGFNFHAPSPRFIAPDDARSITRRMPKRASAVGVFVNQSAARVLRMARTAGLDLVQLHGDESPRFVSEMAKKYLVIKVFRVRSGFRPARLRRYSEAAAFLLDGFQPRLRGGTGKTFDWRLAIEAKRHGPIILAGGITPENVARAIAEVDPFAVDVSSGVEAHPGKKDPVRIRAFMRAVESAQRRVA